MDNGFLLRFLRARKFDYDRAYQLIVNYYTIRAENKDVLKELTPAAVKHVMDSGCSMMLPKHDQHGRCVLYFRPSVYSAVLTSRVFVKAFMSRREKEISHVVSVCEC